jgi:hypothetical protein
MSTGLIDNNWEGVLCTCNKDYCNNASATDIHDMFGNTGQHQVYIPNLIQALFPGLLWFLMLCNFYTKIVY